MHALHKCSVVRVCLSVRVCLLVTTVSCAEMDEPIEMPLGMWTCVGQRKQLLDWGHPLKGRWKFGQHLLAT